MLAQIAVAPLLVDMTRTMVSSSHDRPLAWSATDLNKQYAGNVTQTVGGVKLQVDKDIAGGPLAH